MPGYKDPPLHTRFQKGAPSPNPNGRPENGPLSLTSRQNFSNRSQRKATALSQPSNVYSSRNWLTPP